MCPRPSLRRLGFTLIEIIVTLVVIGIAGVALMSVFTSLTRGSADPLIQQQAVTIAEAYMEEIMLKAFDDPQVGTETETDEGEAGRAFYDDVKDYRSLAAGPASDQFGNGVGLNAFSVAVSVTNAALNSIPLQAGAAGNALRIDIVVSHAGMSPVTLSAYRTRY